MLKFWKTIFSAPFCMGQESSKWFSWIPWNFSFLYISFHEKKKTPNNALTPQCQFTPKMKANAVPHLLSSLVWIDHYSECNGMMSLMDELTATWTWIILLKKFSPLYLSSTAHHDILGNLCGATHSCTHTYIYLSIFSFHLMFIGINIPFVVLKNEVTSHACMNITV